MLPVKPGDRAGKYEILSVLGQGGMGIVFRAYDPELGREVALKCPWPSLAEDPIARKRFIRESRASSKLSHPNIVPILEGFETNGLPWIAFQLIDGRDLQRTLLEHGRIPQLTILRYSEEIAQALAFAHSKGILHRDINPRNILIAKDGGALLTDFGLARTLPSADPGTTSSSDSSLTETGSIMGTARYMSPEQVLGKDVDVRSDLFSLGGVIYEMCTGRHAFGGDKHGEILDAIMHRPPEAISRFTYEISAELERITRKLLAKDPEERYQSARDLLGELRGQRRILESGLSPIPRPAPSPSWKRPIAAAALAGLAAAIALVFVLRHEPTPKTFSLGKPIQVTTSPALEADPAISPDGTRIAYASNENGQMDVYVIDSHGGKPLRLTDHPAEDSAPTWFPDGASIAFVSRRSGAQAIWKVGQMGGSATLLVPNAYDPEFSPDGKWIAFTRTDSTGFDAITMAPLEHVSEARVLSGPMVSPGNQGPSPHRGAAWSPDGREIAFAGWDELWIVKASGGIPERLTKKGVRDREPAWSSDGRTIYFASIREGMSALWRVDRRTKTIERLSAGTGRETRPSVARDGSRLAYCTHSVASFDADNNDIVLLDRTSGEEVVIAGESDDNMPALSPDESFMVFCSNRQGSKYDLWRQSLDRRRPTGSPERITDQPGNASRPAISPDGRWIAYYRIDGAERSIWIVPGEGGLPIQFRNHAVSPSWSPDGMTLAFLNLSSEDAELWIAGVQDGQLQGEPRRICKHSLSWSRPTWSPDGSSIVVVRESETGSDAWIVSAEGLAESRPLTKGAHAQEVRATGSGYAVCGRWGAEQMECRFVDFGQGAILDQPTVDFRGPIPVYVFDMSRDGNLVAFARDRPYGDLWVLEASKGTY
jgi:Tol biopolymer transport system component